MSLDPLNKRIIDLAKQWIHECLDSHASCAKRARHSSILCNDNANYIIDLEERMLMPSFLLQIRKASIPGKPDRVFLTPAQSLDTSTRYVTLSHCWGPNDTFVATTANVDGWTEDGILVDDLPRTFRDAIQVTEQLGYSYLWIDSLCIIQDDRMRWKKDARRMAAIYEGAVCNLMALDGLGADSGLMALSDVQPRNIEARTWVCQERMVSPRSLLFTADSLRWECRECDASEERPQMARRPSLDDPMRETPTHPKDIFTFFRDWRLPFKDSAGTQPSGVMDAPLSPKSPDSEYSEPEVEVDAEGKYIVKVNFDPAKLPGHTKHMLDLVAEYGADHLERLQSYPDDDSAEPFGRWIKIVTNLSHPHADYYPLLETWWQFLRLYTPTQLTFASDRFLAINGIASIAQRWTHLRNTFGLWYHFLENELCWYVDASVAPARRPEAWLGPSWSWMSTRDGSIRNDTYSMRPVVGVLLIKPEIRAPIATGFDMPLPLQAWRPAKYHSMEIKGDLRSAKVTTTVDAHGNIARDLHLSAERSWSDDEKVNFRPDCRDDFPVSSEGVEVFCLHVWHYDAEHVDVTCHVDIYLVLKQVAAGDKNISLQRQTVESSAEALTEQRQMKRLGYLEVTYDRDKIRSDADLSQGRWWWWIELV